ncbi:2681_t:CDS:2 [Paraglomus occultum]|uniref:2681_t:CDS:1 n=1 Tax=Paraglomus occultum TaxID=144539 RepID=A0A9N8WE92_9GLOM|nr:2681_t:CDS:2 [Paraglomus occultum]
MSAKHSPKMKEASGKRKLSIHDLFFRAIFVTHARHWTIHELANLCVLESTSDSFKAKTLVSVQRFVSRLSEAGLIQVANMRTDDEGREVALLCSSRNYTEISHNCLTVGSIEETNQHRAFIECTSSKRLNLASKRCAPSNKRPNRELSSIISDTQPCPSPYRKPYHALAARRLTSPRSNASKAAQKPARFAESIARYPELTDLLERKNSLETEIAKIEDGIRRAKMALNYHKQDKDGVIQALIIKWRNASQEAAEFLFNNMKERMSILERSGHTSWFVENHYNWDEKNSPLSYSDEDDTDESVKHENFANDMSMKSMLSRMGVDIAIIKWNDEDECFED